MKEHDIEKNNVISYAEFKTMFIEIGDKETGPH